MKKFKKFLIILSPLLLVQLLSACSFNTNKNKVVSSDVNNNDDKQIQAPQTTAAYTELSVNHKCIGCGRCTMIDSEHFSMNGRKAEAVSQQNLDSSLLQQAIQVCPSAAIELF